jgi:hypothetical protein
MYSGLTIVKRCTTIKRWSIVKYARCARYKKFEPKATALCVNFSSKSAGWKPKVRRGRGGRLKSICMYPCPLMKGRNSLLPPKSSNSNQSLRVPLRCSTPLYRPKPQL